MKTEQEINEAYEEFAQSLVAKYGFCNWQCKDTWFAAIDLFKLASRGKAPRFPIGLSFQRKRYPKAKDLTAYRIDDIHTTHNNAGAVVKIEYVVSHEFMGQWIAEFMCDTTIARSLTNEQLKGYI